MLRSPFVRWTLGAVMVVLALGALRLQPWARPAGPCDGDAARRKCSPSASCR